MAMVVMGVNETSFDPLVLLPVVLSSLWILWDVFYASYFLAFLLQSILNLFLKDTKISIGQLRLNIITGRLIFKDVEIYRRDDSIRIADGYGALRWWKKPNPTDNEVRCEHCSFQSHACANKKTSLVYLHLNGLEYHWYHRSDIYDAWGQTKISDPDTNGFGGGSWLTGVQPSVHCTINKGKLIFGSQLVENNVVVHFNQAEGQYVVTQASNPYDELMHLVKFHGDNVKVVLQPVPSSSDNCADGVVLDDNGGYIVLKTDFVECVYSLDIPGLVPLDDTSSPLYSFDVQLGSNTFANYGTYVNNQRINLQKHFFPNDYSVNQVDRPPQPGEKRAYTSFDVSVFVTSPATLNVEFEGKTEKHCLSFSVSGASQVIIHQPWVTKENGYVTKFTGKLTELEVMSTLSFRPLAKAQIVNVSSSLHFPRVWNAIQSWNMKFSVDQSQINILFPYVDFFNELLDDWMKSDTIDILEFVPFHWNIGVDMSDYEIFLFTNRYNWIDTDEIENERLAFCGKSGHLSLDMPFTEFAPDEQKIFFCAHGRNIVVRRFFAPSSVSKESVFALSSLNQNRWRVMTYTDLQPLHSLTRSASQPIKPYDAELDGSKRNVERGTFFRKSHCRRGSEPLVPQFLKSFKFDFDVDGKNIQPQKPPKTKTFPMGCCLTTSHNNGWLDIGCGPEITIEITYRGHNSDMRHVSSGGAMNLSQMFVDINAPQVLLRVFGTLARDLLSLKENYPGEYMYFKTFSSQSSTLPECLLQKKDTSDYGNIADERFLDVIVNFKLHNLTGEFPTHYSDDIPGDFPLPSAHSECLSVYVEYKREETIVNLTVDPVTIHLPSIVDGKENIIGVAALSGLSLCCHGFTEFLLKERVEYAWMMKLNIGEVSAVVSLTELFPVFEYFYTAISHIITPGDDVLEAPDPLLIKPLAEPCSEILKYKLFALEVAPIDVAIKEADSILRIQTLGIGADLCNLHEGTQTLSLSFFLKCLNASCLMEIPECSGVYCECACLDTGTVEGDFMLRDYSEADSIRQQEFLRRSDSAFHRLWFLWNDAYSCGCCGGCEFLGGSVYREEFSPILQRSRYFSPNTSIPMKNNQSVPLAQVPHLLSFDNLSAVEWIHQLILQFYGFTDSLSEENVQPVRQEDIELISQDSEASFDTAKQSLHPESFSDDENYASLENSPRVSVKNFSRDGSGVHLKRNNDASSNILHLYTELLDKYWCHTNTVRINYKKSLKHLWTKNNSKSQSKANFKIDFPVFVKTVPGVLPVMSYNSADEILISGSSHGTDKENNESGSSNSISVVLVGNIGCVISPPVFAVINRYLSCVNNFVAKRSLEFFLNAVTFQTLEKVESHMKPASKRTSSMQKWPLFHFSVKMSPASNIALQMLNATTMGKNKNTDSEDARCSVFTLYASGINCNSLIYHEKCWSNEGNDTCGTLQVSYKVVGEAQVPVLQPCFFIHGDSEEVGIPSSKSLLNLKIVSLPMGSFSPRIINVFEGSLHQLSITVAAKIIESEKLMDHILTWDHVETHYNFASMHHKNDLKSSNNLALQIKIPLIKVQVGQPSHGLPSEDNIFIDPAIFATYIKVWKPLIEEVMVSSMDVWRNKIDHEQHLFLLLLKSAMEMPMKNKGKTPLLTEVSLGVRNCVSFSLLTQLWQGLPVARKDYSNGNVDESIILQEIMSVTLSIASRFYQQKLQLPSGIVLSHENTLAASVASYQSISPSPSGLGIPNEAFVENAQSSNRIANNPFLATGTSYSHLVLLRETLVPLLKTFNVKIESQLRRKYHNTTKFSTDYDIVVTKMSVVVLSDRQCSIAPYSSQPEVFVETFRVSGSLDYVTEGRGASKKSNYIITVPGKDSALQNSNIISKCTLNFDTVAINVTLPLLVVIRHTSQSLHFAKHLIVESKLNPSENKLSDDKNISSTRNGQSGLSEIGKFFLELEKNFLQTESLQEQEIVEIVIESCDEQNVGQENNSGGIFLDEIKHSNSSQSSLVSEQLGSPVGVAGSHPISSSSPYDADVVEDTTDSPHFFSSDPEAPVQSSMATYGASKSTLKMSSSNDIIVENGQLDVPIGLNIKDIVNTEESNLEYSVYGSVKISYIRISMNIESLLVFFEMHGISAAVDCRGVPNNKLKQLPNIGVPLAYNVLPSYLSVASTLKRIVMCAQDAAISNNDIGILTAESLEFCTSSCYMKEHLAPLYRCLVRFPEVRLDMKQPPIMLHKKLNKYIPSFTAIYEEVIAPSSQRSVDDKHIPISTPAVSVAELQFPPHIPKGSALFFLKKFTITVRPLPSLMVSYDISPVVVQMGSATVIKFILSVGQHKLEFNSKEYKDDLSLRPIPLPVVLLKGNITPRPHSRLPSVTLEIAVKQVVIEVTTNVLNQLLILQTAFIKEINELFNMFMNVGESLPQNRLTSIDLKQQAGTGFELISLLNSVKLSMQGIKVTVSTPLTTAVRFSTGNKIEMLITNAGHQQDVPSVMSHLTLHGKVETELSVALGSIQGGRSVEEEEDDFIELAYFKTWIAIRNTLQQNFHLTNDQHVSSDMFLISIYSPHLYIQSTAVEKAVLFWVNCKSVYNFWQNEHQQLNAEVQAATEAFVGRLTKPSVQLKTPSIDFAKPRIVQITISDVGACMPLVHLQTTPHASQKGFPAVVLTIKEMHVSLNLSKTLVSAGNFTGFLVRFDEQFHFRHKTWTVDPKRHKFLNHGIVPSGTYKLCIINKNDAEETEKLFCAFKWHMSGINIYACTDIGRHISTLVRTLTIIGSSLEEADSEVVSAADEAKLGHKRAFSVSSKTFYDEQEALRAMEWDLAKQTRKLNKMRQTGVPPDNLKSEEDTFHKLEMELVRGLRRVFRKGRGISLQQIGQILSPRPTGQLVPSKKAMSPSATLPRNRLASIDESGSKKPGMSHRSHVRHQSDISPTVLRLIDLEEGVLSDHLPVVKEEEITHEANVTSSLREQQSLIPSVNIEINVTISVDSGSVVLQSEDVKSQDHRLGSHFSDSPLLPSTRRDKVKSSIDTVLLIPALEVKAHYQSIIGHSFLSAMSSPSKLNDSGEVNSDIGELRDPDTNDYNSPVKKGVLSISATIAPLPHDLELHPSLLDFVEQVVRPIHINIKENGSDEEEDDDLASKTKAQNSVHPLSFPVDVTITFTIHPSKIYLTCSPHAHVKCLIEIPTVDFAISFSLFEQKQHDNMSLLNVDSSMTSSVAEDNVVILNNLHITGCFKTFALVMYMPPVQTGTVKDDVSHKNNREAFNLVLGQAFIHLSRKVVHQNAFTEETQRVSVLENLKVSVIPVVESLLLTYDWRRLNDITWFRKCWYHNGLMEALFTGHKPNDDVKSFDIDQSNTSLLHQDLNEDLNSLNNIHESVSAEIVVAASVVDLRMYANMAQFMGNAHILLSHVNGLSHADVQQNKLVLFACNGGIEEIDVTAEGGVVAGNLAMKALQLHVLNSSPKGGTPLHKVFVRLDIVQGHIDYMSAHIMLLRVVDLHAEAWDVWKGLFEENFTEDDTPSIQICAKLTWVTFQLAMHRSTATALFGIAQRMYDFVMQQKKRSERTIGLMLPPGTAASTAFAAYQEDQKRAEKTRAANIVNPIKEFHHWIWAVELGSSELMKRLGSNRISDECDVSLGGTIDIFGNNFCLVCFHGTSFREAEWATLNVDLFRGQFSTTAMPGWDECNESELVKEICRQSFELQLGQSGSHTSELAAIYRVSAGRGGVPPISHKEIAEWLNYACIHHYIHSDDPLFGFGRQHHFILKHSQKLHIQHIIAIPAFHATVKNDHFWPTLSTLFSDKFTLQENMCTVQCSVSSTFSESIAVTTTVENYLFLHDLFKGYIDHLDKQKISFRPPFTGVQMQHTEANDVCLRNFVSVNWDVEPHLLLMGKSTWASGQINPHISWLLEKLGLDHARTTIPKCIQSGLMDVIDLGIASTLELLISISNKKI